MLANQRRRIGGSIATLIALIVLGGAALSAATGAVAQTPASSPAATGTAVTPTPPRPPALSPAPAHTPAAPTTTGAASGASLDLTRADDGKTFHVAMGTTVTVRLGVELDWTVSIAPPGVLQAVPGVGSLQRGVQALTRAMAPGTATISGEGRPHCDPGQVCAQVRVSFLATVIVAPAAGGARPPSGATATTGGGAGQVALPNTGAATKPGGNATAALVSAIAAVVVAGLASALALSARGAGRR